jgi:hypothetical protein
MIEQQLEREHERVTSASYQELGGFGRGTLITVQDAGARSTSLSIAVKV